MTEKNTNTKSGNFNWENPCKKMMEWDSLDKMIFGITLIWGGLVFLVYNVGMDVEAWALFFLGAGTLILIEVAIRLLNPVYGKSVIGDLIWAGFLFWLGDLDYIWPFIIIAIGVYALFGDRLRSRLTF
jgi:hypothetical protein